MDNWRDTILSEFIPNISRLTIVADPDALLTEEKLALSLRERGFDVMEFNDTIEFRYAYESHYRSIWDQNDHTDLVVVLRLPDSDMDSLPYDLLRTGRRLSFNLGSLFPDLSYPVIETLDRKLFDKLYYAQRDYSPGRIGDNATKDFVLSHVFGISTELINYDVDLLRTLLRIHYADLLIPFIFTERLTHILRRHRAFETWPLESIISDSNVFFAFLQERWPVFLANRSKSPHTLAEPANTYGLKYPGPADLPFDHQDVLVYIDNLFVEGKLLPLDPVKLNVDLDLSGNNSWINSGLTPRVDQKDSRINKFFDLIESINPTKEFRHTDWIGLAMKKAELESLVYSEEMSDQKQKRLASLTSTFETVFSQWLDQYYPTLITIPPTQPAMLHHIPRKLARTLEKSSHNGVALIVVDGLALDQWMTLKCVLLNQLHDVNFQESAVFAWIPTLTSVSRQSIFAGKAPRYFPASIDTTSNEQKLWRQFWEDIGVSKLDVAYQRGLGDGNPYKELDDLISPSKTKVIGLVVDKIDKIMHGMQLGTEGMHNQIKQWAKQEYLAGLIKHLLDFDFQVWLTSDHGNIECVGKGRIAEGVLAETRGERVRVYPTSELRSKILNTHPFTKAWDPIGLPLEYFPLLAEGGDAFVKKDKIIVAHGGASIKEVVVPFVKIERSVINEK